MKNLFSHLNRRRRLLLLILIIAVVAGFSVWAYLGWRRSGTSLRLPQLGNTNFLTDELPPETADDDAVITYVDERTGDYDLHVGSAVNPAYFSVALAQLLPGGRYQLGHLVQPTAEPGTEWLLSINKKYYSWSALQQLVFSANVPYTIEAWEVYSTADLYHRRGNDRRMAQLVLITHFTPD